LDAKALQSIREYLRYLMESGVEEIAVPQDGEAESHAGPTGESGESLADERELRSIREELGECTRCPLSRTRQKIVFGEGNPSADIVFVGEAPGGDEDRTGRPFVGRAGQLLDQIIENGMGLSRSEVYICNVLKCRPPLNRTPKEDEAQVCLPFLEQQITAIRPKVIVTLGRPAAQALLKTPEPMHRLRGNWKAYRGVPVMPTYHPAYVLRNYTVPIRRQVWEDVQEVIRFLEQGGGPA
jgi:DNA polymerase